MQAPASKEERVVGDDRTVLHVDDDAEFADLTATFLQQEADDLAVITETSAADALETLEETQIDCIVSDYDMPGANGLELLEAVRTDYPDLPFILFTGKGSETVASDAISAGVTDYLQKGPGRESYTLLANRVTNAIARRHARTNYREIMEKVPAGIVVHEPATGRIVDMNTKFAAMFGYTRNELCEAGFEVIHPGEEPHTAENAYDLLRNVAETGPQTVRWPGVTKDEERIWCEVNLQPARLDGQLRILAVVRGITERKRQEEQLAYERDSLAALFEAVPEPIVHVRIEDGTPFVERINNAFVDVFGHEEEAAVGASLDDLIVPDRLHSEAQAINRRGSDADHIEERVRRLTTDGEREFLFKAAPIVQEADRVEWVASYVDVTDPAS